MHKEILSESQINLLPTLKVFSDDFGLVGGTAIALHLGHRRSIDFDLFTNKNFSNQNIRTKIKINNQIQSTAVDSTEELTIVTGNVKLTFYTYPYALDFVETFDNIIKMPDILTLAAMKSFALGQRSKWKDYVDIFFILKTHTFESVVSRTKKLFGTEFNERLFREQLSYFKDIDYSEKVDYIKGNEISDDYVKEQLSAYSLK